MAVVKEDVIQTSSRVQLCSGQEAGCEAAIYSMRQLFDDEETEAILLVDAADAFNSINRIALLRNINMLCPCYRIPVRMFVIRLRVRLRRKKERLKGTLHEWQSMRLESHPFLTSCWSNENGTATT